MAKTTHVTADFTMNALYRIQADMHKVTVHSLVTGALMALYDVRENVRPRDAFYKVSDNVRDCAIRARWICQARESLGDTLEEIRVIEVEGKGAWEARYGETLHSSYLGVLHVQRDRLTREIDLAENAQSAALKG